MKTAKNKKGEGNGIIYTIIALILAAALLVWFIFFSKGLYDTMASLFNAFLKFVKNII